MSKFSVFLHSVLGGIQAQPKPPQGVNNGAIASVVAKLDEVRYAIEHGLDDASRNYLDTLIEKHAGPFADVIKGAAKPAEDAVLGAANTVIDGVTGKVEGLLESLGDRIAGLFDGHAAQVADVSTKLAALPAELGNVVAAATPTPAEITNDLKVDLTAIKAAIAKLKPSAPAPSPDPAGRETPAGDKS